METRRRLLRFPARLPPQAVFLLLMTPQPLIRFVSLLALSASLAAGVAGPGRAQWTILLDAQPRRIAADGRSSSQVTALVSTGGGAPAPDGTEVRFTTTAGSIVPVARTAAGRAVAVLTAGSSPNIAQVTAIAGAASAVTEVEFVAGDYQPPSIVLRVEGEVGYSVDQGVLIASGAVLHHGDLRIAADAIEFDERRGQVRAQGNVEISRGDVSVHADALWYSPEESAGALLIYGRQPRTVPFRSDLLTLQSPQPAADLRSFEPFRVERGRSWIRAGAATVWPRERIQFSRAEVLVNGRTVLALPHYFYDYRGTPLNPISQQLRYTQFEGLVVDMPYFFQFGRTRSAAVRLRYAGRGSSYGGFASPRQGFSLGLEQIYDLGGGGGRFFVDSFPSADRSLEWTHSQTFGGGRRLGASLRYQPRSDYLKNALSGSASFSVPMPGWDLSLGAYGSSSESRLPGAGQRSRSTLTSRLDARTRPKPVPGTGLSWRASGAVVRGPVGSGSGLETGFYQSAGVSLTHRPLSLGFASLTLDAGLEQLAGARSGTSLRGRAVLARSLGKGGDLTVTWDQEFAGGTALTSAYRRSLTAALSGGSSDGLSGFAYASWIPGQDAASVTAGVTRPLAAGLRVDASWSFSSAAYRDSFGNQFTSRFSYFRLSLVRPLGLLDIRLTWSPQGRDYGLDRGQKLWLELGGAAF